MAEFYEVPVQLVKGVWDELHTQIVGAMRYHEAMDADDALQLCLVGQLTMVAVAVEDDLTGVVMLRQVRFPKKDVCELVVIAAKNGSTRNWIKEGLEFVEDWALDRGCDMIAGIGRKGWMMATKLGFTAENRAILTKDISNERRKGRRPDSFERSVGGRATGAAPTLQ